MAKNKVKSKSAAKKRFSKTGDGTVKYSKAFRRKKLAQKTRKRKRSLRQPGYLEGADNIAIAKLIPYM
jgi:large subunit ribosomal protein L35